MNLYLIASIVLFGLKAGNAYNPYITSTELRGCSRFYAKGISNFIDIHDFENNIPQNGEILRIKLCFKGSANFFIELSNSTEESSYKLLGILGGWNDTKSVFNLNGNTCGQEQPRSPIFNPDWYTCAFLVLSHHVTETKGTCFIEVRGLEPVMISCTAIENPDQLQFMRIGTVAYEEALMLYDCPIALNTICGGDINLDVAVDVSQSQKAILNA